ncbi:MAG: hypothetical protein WC627_05590 [Legionella sp.]|jgi:hypothetical protein
MSRRSKVIREITQTQMHLKSLQKQVRKDKHYLHNFFYQHQATLTLASSVVALLSWRYFPLKKINSALMKLFEFKVLVSRLGLLG